MLPQNEKLIWAALPSQTLKITEIKDIHPRQNKLNIQCMLLETWPIKHKSISAGMYVADSSGSCIVYCNNEQDIRMLQPGDILVLISVVVSISTSLPYLSLKIVPGSKIERIGTTALFFNRDPCVSLLQPPTNTGDLVRPLKGPGGFPIDPSINQVPNISELPYTQMLPPSLYRQAKGS